MERTFNAEQQRVIEACGGHHLVLAPPGCGKTAVLAERIAWAYEHGVPFSDMACLTFTNRAARGMKERIEARLGQVDDLDSLFVGNVHRFCLHFLAEQGLMAEHTAVVDTDTSISILTDFLGEDELQVLDDNRSRQRYSQIINLQHLMRQVRQGYPSQLIVHRDALPAKLLRELCNAFHIDYSQQSAVQLYMHADLYRDDDTALLSKEARQLLMQLYAARQYEAYKQQNDLLDFGDLLLNTYDALQTKVPPSASEGLAPPTAPEGASIALQRKGSMVAPSGAEGGANPSGGERGTTFRWLQIDEVQDLSPLQLAIVDHFTAPDATVVFLGDPQQAIFSFMGAKTDTLAMLRQRCGDAHLHNFYQNYRSPQYLLDVFNRYAQWQLGIDAALLPTTHNHQPQQTGDLQLLEAHTNVDEANMVARLVQQLHHQHPDETIAVVVAFNSDADEVSAALGTLPHFKISGTDFFDTAPVRLLLAHLGVCIFEHNFIAWSHIFAGLGVYASCSAARQAVRSLTQLAISPTDLLLYDGSTYVAQFVAAYEQHDIVVFDTETTGLDVSTDDVVQIAALRVHRGRVVDELNLFIATTKEIPPMLGDVPNPLVDEYARHRHLQPREALEQFVLFARGCDILGHNATYDYQIMHHMMLRHAPHLKMAELWPTYFDTLKLTRLLHPRQKSYKLRDLLVQLQLQGTNSHLANDDIVATLSLMVHCYERGRSIEGRQREFLSRHKAKVQRFRMLYAELHQHTCKTLPQTNLTDQLRYAYHYLLERKHIPELPKMGHLLRYIDSEWDGDIRHYADLCTLKEADLCGSASMEERIFVSTVHKAKGLEFDTVVVYDAVDGKYPSVFARDAETQREEARKFYVALTRARRRLVVSYCHNAVTRWGAWYAKVATPFLQSLRSCFS